MIVDSLATGSLFSFAWNLLISVSFNFVGFLLTYLLHTTHAARFGSRTGLGITLIQYGFALRKTLDDSESGDLWKSTWNPPLADTPRPTFPTAAESGGNTTISSATAVGLDEDAANTLIANATTEWLSFFLMAIGKNFCFLCFESGSTRFRLVHRPHFCSRILEDQTMGKQHHLL